MVGRAGKRAKAAAAVSKEEKRTSRSARLHEKLHLTTKRSFISASLQKKRQKRRAGLQSLTPEGLQSLAEALPEAGELAGKGGDKNKTLHFDASKRVVHNRTRSKILTHETAHMASIMSHQLFQESPFATLARHIAAIVPADADADHQPAINKAKRKSGSAKRKERRERALMGGNMETG